MPVGSHKDAFKAHQFVKKIAKEPRARLAKFAADIIMDFVKSQRQVVGDQTIPEKLEIDDVVYDDAKLTKALEQVESLCGKCEDSHVDSCFVNQARRALIAAKTKVDLGYEFNGKKTLQELLAEAEAKKTEIEKQAGGQQASAKLADVPGASAAKLSDIDTDRLKEELEEYKEKDVFRATLIDEIVSTISAVTSGDYAAEMPVHDDEQLGKLANAFNIMLKAIERNMSELDSIVAARSAELKQIMRSIPIGLLTIDKNCRINPEYSASADRIIGVDNLRGRNFLDTIGITKKREKDRLLMEDFFDVITMGTLSEEDLEGLNPFPELEFIHRRTGEKHWLKTKFYLLGSNKRADGEDGKNILVLLEDITEQKALAAKIAKAAEENTQLRAIVEDTDLFRDFLRESLNIFKNVSNSFTQLTSQLEEAYSQNKDIAFAVPMVHEIFRGVHTIKGAAGTFLLSELTQAADSVEAPLSAARDNVVALTKDFLSDISIKMENLRIALSDAAELAKKITGEDIRESSDIMLKVPHARLKAIEKQLFNLKDVPCSTIESLVSEIYALQSIPAKKALAKSIKAVPRLCERLNKNVNFVVIGEDESIYCEAQGPLNNALIHMLRNAIDHGIEPEEERIEKGKPPQGTVKLKIKSDRQNVTVTISDDGKGLDPDALKKHAAAKGIISAAELNSISAEQAQYLIFKPGFSTADTVTDVSGRGVGMDAVWKFITKDLNGKIQIDSQADKGTTFTILFSAAGSREQGCNSEKFE